MSDDFLSINEEHRTLYSYLDAIYRNIGDALASEPVMIVPVCPPAGVDVYEAMHQIYSKIKPKDEEVLLYRSPVGMSPAYIAVYHLKGVQPAPPKEIAQFIDPATCKSGYLCYGMPGPRYMADRKKEATVKTYNYVSCPKTKE